MDDTPSPHAFTKFMRFSDPELANLIDEIWDEKDQEKQKQLMEKAKAMEISSHLFQDFIDGVFREITEKNKI